MKLLQVEGLVKGFGGNNVVDGVSFSVSEGEVVGFVGPNGAGKSTTMKMISGLLKPNSGAVSIDGLAFRDDPKRYLAKIGVLIESPAFYPELTARDHLAYLARMRGHWDTSIVRDALAHVGLSADSNKSVRKYSTGMKQRLGIAMAILHNPRVLILDEPTNGLDPAAIVAVRELMRNLADHGTGILVSSHLLSEIERVCNRVVFIKGGRIVRDENIQAEAQHLIRMLVCSNDLERAQEILSKQEFVLDIVRTDRGILCLVQHNDIGQLAAAIVNHGVALLELSPATKGLENTYVSEYGSGMKEGLE